MHHHPLIQVVIDLWYFVIDGVRYYLPFLNKNPFLSQPRQLELVSSTLPPSLMLTSAQIESVAGDVIFADIVNKVPIPNDDYPEYEFDMDMAGVEFASSSQYFESYDPVVMYVVVNQTVCIVKPQRDFDAVLAKFPYGSAVTVIGYQGNYAKVFLSHHEGWIKKDDLTPHKGEVWPHFTNGVIYKAEDEAVKKLRLLIADTFYTNELDLPLQGGEWIVYRLREQNRLIPWPVTHGRIPGDWRILLKGLPGVHISIIPKTDSIMEWRGDDGIGRLAYVEKMTADQTLTVTIAGYEEPGRFEERVFTEIEWRELRPVFIEVF